MNGIDKIKERIISDAKLQADEIVKKANLEAEEIIKAATQSADIATKKIIEEAKKEAGLLKERSEGNALSEAKKEGFKTKQNMIDDVFNKAIEELCDKPDNEYEKILSRMVIDMAETGDEEILINQKDKKRLSKDFIDNINILVKKRGLNSNMKLSSKDAHIKGGAILKNGDVEINGSFEAIVKAKKEYIEPDIFNILFN
jgi:V/A-type H+-transporting ATPase subunit E